MSYRAQAREHQQRSPGASCSMHPVCTPTKDSIIAKCVFNDCNNMLLQGQKGFLYKTVAYPEHHYGVLICSTARRDECFRDCNEVLSFALHTIAWHTRQLFF